MGRTRPGATHISTGLLVPVANGQSSRTEHPLCTQVPVTGALYSRQNLPSSRTWVVSQVSCISLPLFTYTVRSQSPVTSVQTTPSPTFISRLLPSATPPLRSSATENLGSRPRTRPNAPVPLTLFRRRLLLPPRLGRRSKFNGPSVLSDPCLSG